MAEAAPARILDRGERTVLPPMLCLARIYEKAAIGRSLTLLGVVNRVLGY